MDIWVSEKSPDRDWLDKVPASNAQLDGGKDSWDRHSGTASFLITPDGHIHEGRIEEAGENTYYDYDLRCSIYLFSSALDTFKELRNSEGELLQVIAPKGTILRRYKDDNDSGAISLGNQQLWMLRLIEGAESISVQKRVGTYHDDEFVIDNTLVSSKSAALEYLMRKHYLSQENAETLLKEAAASVLPIHRLREKVAFSGEVPRDKLSVTFPQKEKGHHDITGLEVEQDLFTEEPVDALRPAGTTSEEDLWPGLMSADTDKTDASPPTPNAQDMQLASQAARLGQKDFVSAQMLMSLLREVDDDGIINKYIVIFEKACDTLGRLYMQVLWRTDSFKDRFGETQLKDFREMLVSLFQQMGDFICYLRQRDIRPSPVLSLDSVEIENGEMR
jgi:hypothetical protein